MSREKKLELTLFQVQLALVSAGPLRADELTGRTGFGREACARALAELGRRGWAREKAGKWHLVAPAQRRHCSESKRYFDNSGDRHAKA